MIFWARGGDFAFESRGVDRFGGGGKIIEPQWDGAYSARVVQAVSVGKVNHNAEGAVLNNEQ